MNIIKITVITALLGSLSGCATTWYNPSKSSQQLYADRAYCRSISGSGGSSYIPPSSNGLVSNYNTGAAIGAAMRRDSIFEDCMMGQGWRKR